MFTFVTFSFFGILLFVCCFYSSLLLFFFYWKTYYFVLYFSLSCDIPRNLTKKYLLNYIFAKFKQIFHPTCDICLIVVSCACFCLTFCWLFCVVSAFLQLEILECCREFSSVRRYFKCFLCDMWCVWEKFVPSFLSLLMLVFYGISLPTYIMRSTKRCRRRL